MILFAAFSLTAVLARCSVKIYDERFWNGKSCTIYSDKPANLVENISSRSGCPDNNYITKIVLAGKCSLDLFEDTSYGGSHVRLDNTGSSSKTYYDLHFTAHRSLRVDEILSCGSGRYSVRGVCGPCRVTFSEHAGHKNGRWCDRGDTMGTVSIAGSRDCPANDKLSFVKVEGSCRVELYEHSSWGGNQWNLNGAGSYSGTSSYFVNDAVSSFKIYAQNGRRLEAKAANAEEERVLEAEDVHDISRGGVYHMDEETVRELEEATPEHDGFSENPPAGYRSEEAAATLAERILREETEYLAELSEREDDAWEISDSEE